MLTAVADTAVRRAPASSNQATATAGSLYPQTPEAWARMA